MNFGGTQFNHNSGGGAGSGEVPSSVWDLWSVKGHPGQLYMMSSSARDPCCSPCGIISMEVWGVIISRGHNRIRGLGLCRQVSWPGKKPLRNEEWKWAQ